MDLWVYTIAAKGVCTCCIHSRKDFLWTINFPRLCLLLASYRPSLQRVKSRVGWHHTTRKYNLAMGPRKGLSSLTWSRVGMPVLVIGSGALFWILSKRTKQKEEENVCEEYVRFLSECMKAKPPINCQHQQIDLNNCVMRAGSVDIRDKGLKPIQHTNL